MFPCPFPTFIASDMLHLFQAFGIELEYMIVDNETLDVLPISDFVLKDEHGEPTSELEQGETSWSNELTHHVIEIKTNGPAAEIPPLASQFQNDIQRINQLLAPANARLLPTAMHPWMNPDRELQLWPHEYHTVYEAFDKIFDCRGHGWANLQSMHINLPFSGDVEFAKLHAAIRLILPFLPAIAASSPFMDGIPTGLMDTRMDVYRKNSKGFATIAGRIIPEQVFDEASYDREIFQPMFRDIAPFDPDEVLRNEFLNARGAIARFSRGAIEIRVIDVQESPRMDIAIAALTTQVIQLLVKENWTSLAEQQDITIDDLEPTFLSAIADAGNGAISNAAVLKQFGIDLTSITLRDFWRLLFEEVCRQKPLFRSTHGEEIEVILNEGCLASRIIRSMHLPSDPEEQRAVYKKLADCLHSGSIFHAESMN
ncbi:carboxylate-amine ligase [Planctomicrobium sp. SH668]|uniref:carboxylate-amine ligase n=1 Tax=Planctomicrobium sp. SH668 TaxID=3448126 RepID=UPI003F5BFE76